MKIISYSIILVLLSFQIKSQTFDFYGAIHPVIEKLEVAYKQAPNLSSSSNSSLKVNTQQIATIKLKTDSLVSKLFFKIVNLQDKTILYDVNYAINSPTKTNADGLVLFKRENNVITITNPNPVELRLYQYELITEDEKGIKSLLYQSIQ
jgi:hypothetical protein